jgi:hypothetical protein
LVCAEFVRRVDVGEGLGRVVEGAGDPLEAAQPELHLASAGPGEGLQVGQGEAAHQREHWLELVAGAGDGHTGALGAQGFGEAWDKGMREAFDLLKNDQLGKRPFRLRDLPNYVLMELWMIWNMVPYLWYRLVVIRFGLK